MRIRGGDKEVMKTLIYGTGNAAKLKYMQKTLEPLRVEIMGLNELDLLLPTIDESGNNPLENARIKALTYYRAIKKQTGKHYPVFSCDSGLYLENAPEALQPGVHVRNVGGKYLNDDEMIEYYAGLAKSLGGQAVARYKNAICLVISESEIFEHMGDNISGNSFVITSTPHPKRIDGFPLDSLSIHIVSGKYYYDLDKDSSDVGIAKTGFRSFFRRVLNIENSERYYNKLVRDNIPEIISRQDIKPITRLLDDEEYLIALDKKLNEEVLEYLADGSIGEICDILEVIDAICKARGISPDQIAALRSEKRNKNGGFDKRIFLEKVISGGHEHEE